MLLHFAFTGIHSRRSAKACEPPRQARWGRLSEGQRGVRRIRERDQPMAVRGIRGATSVDIDEKPDILAATRELLVELLRVNGLEQHFDEIASAIFTTTRDLTSAFPAEAARSLGMSSVPLLCASEIPVSDSLPRCIRVLLHVNTDKPQAEMVHVYLRDAKKLRPDVSSAQ